MIRVLTKNELECINRFLLKFDSIPLGEKDLENKLHHYIGYEVKNEIVGFACYSIYYDRAEIDYIYVVDAYRNQNIAKKLLDYIIKLCKNNCYNITLEVGKNNYRAIKLYKKYDFKPVKIMKNYYKNDDGILMLKELD